MELNPRLRALRPEEDQPSCFLLADVKSLRQDYVALKRRKMYASVLSLMVLAQWGIMALQLVGVLVPGDDWLEDSQGSRNTTNYHILTLAQSVCIMAQILCITKWYKLRLKNLTYFDRLWRDVGLLESAHRVPYILEVIFLLLHEPPFLVVAWNNSYKLQAFALLRFYIFFNFFRGRSYSVTMGGRLVCVIARVTNNKWFQVRYWVHESPAIFMLSLATTGWFLLSIAMYMAEAASLNFDEAMWLTFITMTTVGYGDFSPVTSMGRFVAALTAIHGLVASAMLINIISNSFSLSPSQKRVVDFVHEAKLSSKLETMAIVIVQTAFRQRRAHKLGKNPRKWTVRLKHICAEYRKLRREFRIFQLSVHNHGEVFDLDTRLRGIEKMIKTITLSAHTAVASPQLSAHLSAGAGGGLAPPSLSGAASEASDVLSQSVIRPIGDVNGGAMPKSFAKLQARNVVHQALTEIMQKLDHINSRQDAFETQLKAIAK